MEHTPATVYYTNDKFKDEDGRIFEVAQDETAEDPREWLDDVAIITLRMPGGYAPPEWSGGNIEEAARAIWDECGDMDALENALNAVPGWTARTTTLHGYCQSAWADVVALTEYADNAEETIEAALEIFAQWRRGDVWLVSEEGGEAAGGIYADTMQDAIETFKAGGY